MFFNENLYLEADDATPVSDEEIKDTVDADGGSAAGDPEAMEKLESFCVNAYSESLEWQLGATEHYYNLREKMMNIEHVASIKKAQGLVSESEALIQEGASAFMDKVKAFFVSLGKLIENLFAKFVNFISSLFVSSKTILNLTSGEQTEAWSKYEVKNKNTKVKLLNLKPAEMSKFAKYAKKITAELNTGIASINSSYAAGEKSDVLKGLKAKLNEKNIYANELLGSLLGKEQTVLQKKSIILDKTVFEERVKYCKYYKGVITEVKLDKDEAKKTVNDAIKTLKGIESRSVDRMGEGNENYSSNIAGIRRIGSLTQSVFSKLISISSAYYRESMAIAKRVIGGANVADAKKDFKKMTSESFDFDSYFAD